MPHNPHTIAALRDAIRARGPLTLADFMQIALYHPQHGYYRHAKIGRAGDFMTSVSTGPVWGKIWARHFFKLLENFQSLEKTAAGTSRDWKKSAAIYEFGGNTGQFRDDVLTECPELDYRIFEAGDPLPEKMEGIVFSNELIDALPFHRVRFRDGIWFELLVGLDGNENPILIEGELRDSRLRSFVESNFGFVGDLKLEICDFEICPAAEDWIRQILSRLIRGYVITVDYGMTREEYFSKPRPAGTLRCYHKHTRNDDPLEHIGEQDITADVDFTSFIAAGEAAGLETVLFTDQTHALLEIGRDVIEEITTRDAGRMSKDRNAIHQLLHPSMMGRRFKVLIQRKRG